MPLPRQVQEEASEPGRPVIQQGHELPGVAQGPHLALDPERVGLEPQVFVRPTLASVQKGQDEVLRSEPSSTS